MQKSLTIIYHFAQKTVNTQKLKNDPSVGYTLKKTIPHKA